jgi:hypothetical protein
LLQNASKELNNQKTVVKKRSGAEGEGEEHGRGIKNFYNFAITYWTCIVLGHLRDLQENKNGMCLVIFSCIYNRS